MYTDKIYAIGGGCHRKHIIGERGLSGSRSRRLVGECYLCVAFTQHITHIYKMVRWRSEGFELYAAIRRSLVSGVGATEPLRINE